MSESIANNCTQSSEGQSLSQTDAAFSIMFVSVCLSCFVWQIIYLAQLLRHSLKPIYIMMLAQAVGGCICAFVTLLTSLVPMSCDFRLNFSIVTVNLGDIAIQTVLLWKAYICYDRSQRLLVVGSLPLFGILIFIVLNCTVGRSSTYFIDGVCTTFYPTWIVAVKAALDFTSNLFLSLCFLRVIYRHYQVLGSSLQKALLKDGIIYCIGAILSNLICGVLLIVKVLGGLTPILYTLDWSLASYLIIKQLKGGRSQNDLTAGVATIHLPPYQRSAGQSRLPLGCTISTCEDHKLTSKDLEHGHNREVWEY